MKQKSSKFKKLIIALLIIIICNFSFSCKSNAISFTGVLTKPICYIFVQGIDAFNRFLTFILYDGNENVENLSNVVFGDQDESDTTILDRYFNALISPDKIFSGNIEFLNANIFTAKSAVTTVDKIFNPGTTLTATLKSAVSNIYILLRNIAALILLCLLIYTGIRILLMSVSPYNQARWKQALIDWVKALCLLVFMHVIMVGIFYVSDALVEGLSQSLQDTSIVGMIRKAFAQESIWEGGVCVMLTIMYGYITYLTIVFFIAYFKRLVWVILLIVISPVVAVSYALGEKQKAIFGNWFKEFIMAVLLQPFHMLIFYVLVLLPLNSMGATATGATDGWALIKTFGEGSGGEGSFVACFYALIAMSMIRPSEKFLMKLFGFDTSVAKQGSSESGVKTIKATEKVVTDVVKTGVQIAAIVGTGGAAAGATGAGATGAGATGAGATGAGATGAGATGIGLDAGSGLEYMDEEESVGDWISRDKIHESDRLLQEPEYSTADRMSEGELNKFLDEQVEGQGLDEKERADLEKELRGLGHGNKDSGDDKLDKTANKLSDAADKLGDKVGNFNVSDAEFDQAMGDQTSRSKNKLMEKLENNPLYEYARSPEGKEMFNELRAGANELRDTMYLDAAPQEWKKGEFGYDKTKGMIDQNKKDSLNAFVNNKNNINYIKQTHDLSTDDAKKRLQEAEPYINRGITDIGAIDKMISAGREGRTPDQAIRAVAKDARMQVNINRTVNDQSKISAVAQIIANSTGSRVDSPKVQQQAKQTMEAARPYIAKGEKDPEILHRLVQLENNLKNSKVGANLRTPDKVMRMDKKIDQAMNNGLNKVQMKTNQSTSQGMKQLESLMNKELRNRKGLGSNN